MGIVVNGCFVSKAFVVMNRFVPLAFAAALASVSSVVSAVALAAPSELVAAARSLPTAVESDAAAVPWRAEQLRGMAAHAVRLADIVERGGWGPFTDGAKLEPGARDPRAWELRRRLMEDAPELAEQPGVDFSLYDAGLADAVKQFQARHGLSTDGVVAKGVVAALNKSATERLGQLVVSYDRIKAAPEPKPGVALRVNIPAFQLEILEDGVIRETMPVIVGRVERPTPLFSSNINLVTLNPTWSVPVKLAKEDILPKLRRNAAHMADAGFYAYRADGSNERVPVTEIDWTQVKADRIGYWFRQEPGGSNSLGKLKISMPNAHDIYLHDTPDRHLFARDMRALSSGCIRLQRPIDLAALMLRDTGAWSAEKIRSQIGARSPSFVTPSKTTPIALDYVTLWVDAQGVLQSRDDIYGHDKAELRKMLAPKAAAPAATPTADATKRS